MNDDLEPILSGEEILPDSTNTTLTTVPPEEPTEPYEVTTGLEVPAQAIEKGTLNLGVISQKIQNFALDDFFVVDEADTSELADAKREMLAGLRIDNEVDNSGTRIEKMLNLLILSFNDGIGRFYGVPIEQFGERVRHKPQVCLKFREKTINEEDTPVRARRLVKEVSFRLMSEIPNSLDDLKSLREKILNTFAGYSWLVSKDKTLTYRDEANGYRLAIDAEKDVFTELVTKVLSIQEHTYDEVYVGSYDINRPETPPTATVFGEQVTLPFRGRWGTVEFWKAEYKQAGIADKILAVNYDLDWT